MNVTRKVTLRDMVAAMARAPDDAPFRWWQDSAQGQPLDTLLVTMCQARAELGLTPAAHEPECAIWAPGADCTCLRASPSAEVRRG